MSSKTNHNLRIGFGLSALLLIISSLVSYICIRNLISSGGWVRHSNEIRYTLEGVMSSLKDAETGQRGFLLTGNSDYLTPYNSAYHTALKKLDKVLALTEDNPIQQQNGRELNDLILKRAERLQQMIDNKKQGIAVNDEDLRIGKTYMDNIRVQADRMLQEENRLLQRRMEKQQKFVTYTPAVILISALLSIGISVFFYLSIVKDIADKNKLHQALKEKDEDLSQRIEMVQHIAGQIAQGDYYIRINEKGKDSLGSLATALNRMAESLAFSFGKLSDNEWLQRGVAQLNEKMVGQKDIATLTSQVIEFAAVYTGSHIGALYLLQNDKLVLSGGYALPATVSSEIPLGQGIVGQSLRNQEEILLEDVDPEYVAVSHATGNIRPKAVVAYPVFHEGAPVGVMELAAIKNYTDRDRAFLKTIAHNIGTAIVSAVNYKRLQELLEETQAQSEELQTQHSELENMNAELEAHAQKLQASEEELRVQQEELQQSNAELEERNHIINLRNLEIQKKAEELEQSTRYKSEFMANMSHELRTPLNSILLLSRYLYENSEQNLNEDQQESAKVIFNSGSGLLDLIDELLDLSKIEAGKMDLDYVQVSLSEVMADIHTLFLPIAKDKKLELRVQHDLEEPQMMETDRTKLEQILKNLLSNALKFTSEGYVSLKIERPDNGAYLHFIVEDTGIGIPEDKQDQVFEAFTQADGSTRRKYGGTGLGLSISRELARLLAGEITVSSIPGKGSTFTLVLPVKRPEQNISQDPALPAGPQEKVPAAQEPGKVRHLAATIPEDIADDRDQLQQGDKVILIIEDDTAFAGALLRYARQQQYKGIVTVRGDQAVEMARRYKPAAILLDIQLPVMDGWEVMEALKSDAATRHIPVHIMSSFEVKKESRWHGAVDFINKPVALEQMKKMFMRLETVLNKHPKKVLIIEENTKHAQALSNFLDSYNISSGVEHNIQDSIRHLQNKETDCVILDMGIPGQSAYETLETVKTTPGMEDIPVIVFTGKSLSQAEENRIRQYADSIVVKTAHSYQRILDEVGLFLHLVETGQQSGPRRPTGSRTEILSGKTVLIADDDVRNIFSLTKALEKHQVHVITATDGAEALQQLEKHPQTDIVLMDMMMPQMDGYESTTRIRQHPRFKHIPVIAVTAKAMLGDREKCIAAGASDYISKPVDTDQLVSLLRVWLYDKPGIK